VTLVDTNVLLDVVTDDPVWSRWSAQQMEAAALRGPLLINDVIYAELSARYLAIEELDRTLASAGVNLEPMPRAALFLAGKAFLRYRTQGGPRTGVLSDFFVGAHAAVTATAAAHARYKALSGIFSDGRIDRSVRMTRSGTVSPDGGPALTP
jgi:predicted nucleic acid-binding protein